MKRHRQPLEVMSSINVTNLLDTAFILLITFMLVAPTLTHGIKLKLPEVKAPKPLEQDPAKSILISVQARQEDEEEEWVFIQRPESTSERVDMQELFAVLREEFEANENVSVVVEADRDSRSGKFIEVIGEVKRAGIENVGLTTLEARGDKDER